MRPSTYRCGGWSAAIVAILLAAPAVAPAQSTKPGVHTGGVADRTFQSATLLGTVTPNGAQTTYRFEYGATKRLGAVTPSIVAPSRTGTANVTAPLGALAPFTTYHYRLVASNRNAAVRGALRSFKTRRQPLGLTLAALPSTVALGKPAILAGALTGTGNAGRQIRLESNPFPYTRGFAPTANVQLADARGRFAFPLLSVPRNTLFRVLIADRQQIVSPLVNLGVAVRVATYTSATRVRTGRVVRFFGTVRPARDRARFAVQRRVGKRWITVAGGAARGTKGGVSRYAKKVRIRRGGRYRVFVAVVDGEYVSSAGRTVRIRRIF